jgi:hypothetical protein
MGEIYLLKFQDEAFEIFQSPKTFNSERSLINEMVKFDRSSRIHLVDTQVKFIFERFDSINHRSNRWQDNLKTLLAHDFHIATASNRTLSKSFRPVQFMLSQEGRTEAVHFGFYFKEIGEDVAQQFIEFCKATEYPAGIHAHIIESVLISSGGALVAIEPESKTTLIKRDPLTDIITGEDSVIRYLTKLG